MAAGRFFPPTNALFDFRWVDLNLRGRGQKCKRNVAMMFIVYCAPNSGDTQQFHSESYPTFQEFHAPTSAYFWTFVQMVSCLGLQRITLWKRCLSHHLLWTFNAKLCAASSIQGTPPQWHAMLEKLKPIVLGSGYPAGPLPGYPAWPLFGSNKRCLGRLAARYDRDKAEQLSVQSLSVHSIHTIQDVK